MEFFKNEYFSIILSSIAVYVFIVVAIRIFGKKELSQLSVIDLVFILLISNAVQNAMVGPNTTLSGGIVAATTLFIVNYCFKYLLFKFPKLQGIIAGEPKVLIYKGEILKKQDILAKLEAEPISKSKKAGAGHGGPEAGGASAEGSNASAS